jgi:flagellar biosynthetic protein FliP
VSPVLSGFGRLALAGVALLLAVSAPAFAQEVTPGLGEVAGDLLTGGDGEGLSATAVQLFVIITVLSLAPGLAMMTTCLPFMVIVFSFLRQAIGLQQAPPNMMIMGLAIFLTFFVMEPVFTRAWAEGITPYIENQIAEGAAWERTTAPFREMMLQRIAPGTMEMLSDAVGRPLAEGTEPGFALVSTAFMLSEIKHAFQIGFVIFLPFLVIDLVVSAILMAVGMMMVPPTVVSLPFKIGFVVLADGWLLISEALLRGYVA